MIRNSVNFVDVPQAEYNLYKSGVNNCRHFLYLDPIKEWIMVSEEASVSEGRFMADFRANYKDESQKAG